MTKLFWDAPLGPVDLCSLLCVTFACSVLFMSIGVTFPSLLFVFFLFYFFMSLLFVLCLLITTFLPSAALSSPVSPFTFSSAAVRCRNPGGVSSGQSYPSAQYESGLQQRGQQGEQPGHQPRPLLHTPRWVAVVDGYPGGMMSKIIKEKWNPFFYFIFCAQLKPKRCRLLIKSSIWCNFLNLSSLKKLRVIFKKAKCMLSAFLSTLKHCSISLRLMFVACECVCEC